MAGPAQEGEASSEPKLSRLVSPDNPTPQNYRSGLFEHFTPREQELEFSRPVFSVLRRRAAHIVLARTTDLKYRSRNRRGGGGSPRSGGSLTLPGPSPYLPRACHEQASARRM